jgi:hypothetical protein
MIPLLSLNLQKRLLDAHLIYETCYLCKMEHTDELRSQPQFSTYLFWDSNPELIDFERDKNKVIRRVFDMGRIEDVVETLWFYKREDIIHALITASYLPQNAILLGSALFQLKNEDFKCYTSKQYHQLF